MNTCCEGQGTRVYGSLPEYIYTIADDGIYVDLFAAAEIKFTVKNQPVNLKMNTQFPYDSKVEMVVGNENPVQYKIRIRVPSWSSKNMTVLVNGKNTGTGKPGAYITIERKWSKGDAITFTLPMDFRVTKYTGIEPGFENNSYAIEYGPILLALVNPNGSNTKFGLKASPENIKKLLKPIQGKPLHFSIDGNSEFEYLPYFEVQDEKFTCFPEFSGKASK